ncbi:uncharacterized protein LAESUDRAFT_113991 [Laetiporus sulphureus 93-53]|uniref:Uncharacterized protein n=1 Tax=Laetiporus sulphureus 93-53 TaxID=1314785 RepID=A0A165EPW5_9APHY|nr:uncharacterized protein LAESUDRAFT_113991 [Laetiporus sulphureus 93-53]KZT07516.1 hypothetical protein LAESUDRAFT_113991 [Laetiporus sulphureus 93-53]
MIEEGKTESQAMTTAPTSATQFDDQPEDLTLQPGGVISGDAVPIQDAESSVAHPPALQQCQDFFQGTSIGADMAQANFNACLKVVGEHRGLQCLELLRISLQLENALPLVLAEALWSDPDQQRREHPRPPRSNADLNRLLGEGDIATFALNACSQPSPPSDMTINSELEQRQQGYLAFHSTYKGDALDRFKEQLQHCQEYYDTTKHHGRYIALLQSSGTGKSRLVSELSHDYPTVSVCLRKENNPEDGWPPVDTPAYEFLKEPRSTRYMGEELAAAFLGALFEQVTVSIERSIGDRPSDLMASWDLPFDPANDYSRSARFDNFAAVKANASILLQKNLNELVALRRFKEGKDQDTPVWHRHVYGQLCQAAADRLREVLRKRLGPRFKYFIVAIDECTQLGSTLMKYNDSNVHRGSAESMSATAMQNIMKAADMFHKEFWYLLLDTNSAIFDLVPPTGNLPHSFRLDGKPHPLPPWGYFGFDQMVKGDIEQNGVPTLMQALTLNRIKMYGRPYWSTLPEDSLIPQARRKLLSSDRFDPQEELSVLALYSARVLVEIAEGPPSCRLAINSVRSHMRLFVSIVDRNTVETCSPSEPILALAAAHTLNVFRKSYVEAIQTFINKLVLQGVVRDRSATGELASRFLLMMTRDAATPKYIVCSDSMPTTSMLATVKVTDFLTKMIGEDALENAASFWALKNFGDNAHINFTHFIQLPEIIEDVTTEFLYYLWCRTAAVQCAMNQPVIDGFIVVYCSSLNEPFDPMKLSYIAWRTNVKDQATSSDSLVNTLTGPSVIHAGVRHKPKHIVILMDLAVSTESEFVSEFRLSHAEATVPSGGRRWGGYIEQEPKRFCLSIRGHDYAVLKIYDREIRGSNPSESCLTPLFRRTLAGRDDQSGACVRQIVNDVCNLSGKDFIGNMYQSGKIR